MDQRKAEGARLALRIYGRLWEWNRVHDRLPTRMKLCWNDILCLWLDAAEAEDEFREVQELYGVYIDRDDSVPEGEVEFE